MGSPLKPGKLPIWLIYLRDFEGTPLPCSTVTPLVFPVRSYKTLRLGGTGGAFAGPLCGAEAAPDAQNERGAGEGGGSCKSPSSPVVQAVEVGHTGAQLMLESRRPGSAQGLSISFCEIGMRSAGLQLLMRCHL